MGDRPSENRYRALHHNQDHPLEFGIARAKCSARVSYKGGRFAATQEDAAHLFMRNLTILGAVTGPILAAGASFAQIPAEHVQTGTFTCDICSQKGLNCSFVPMLRGPPEFYSGVINKLGIDLGGTRGGVMVWAVYAPTMWAAGFLAGRRRFRRSHGGSRNRREHPRRRLIPHGRAAAALGSGADQHQRQPASPRSSCTSSADAHSFVATVLRAELDERFHGGNLISSDEIAYTLSTSEKMTPFTWPTPRRL